jgi:divalent metal cation (Fe/Co/Zn/Cd) transporter
MGFERADPIVGLVISVAIFAVLRGAMVQVFHRLMDAVDPDLVDQVESVAAATDGVKGVESIRVRWSGHRLAVTLAIVVADELTVGDAHAVAEEVRHHLVHAVRHLDEIDIHVDPTGADGTDPHATMAHHNH